MVHFVEKNESSHEVNSSATTSTESHLGAGNLSNPESYKKTNESQTEQNIKVPANANNSSSATTSTESHLGSGNASNPEPEKKTNETQIEQNIKMPTNANNSSVDSGNVETVNTDNKTSTARRLLEDNSKAAEKEDSVSKDSNNEGLHAATVENAEGLEADADSSFELFRNSDELADEYSYDYDDYVDGSMWGDEEWTEVQHEKLEDYVNIDSHILCTPVSNNSTF